jgi:hypothetical protein
MLADSPAALLGADARQLGVMPAYKGTLAELPLVPGRLANEGPWPGAATLASRLRTLPSHGLVRSVDVDAIVELMGRNERRRS